MSLYNFLYVLEDFVKIRCMTDQKLQKDRMLSNRVPLTEIRRPAAILKCSPLPPPTLRHSLRPDPLDGQLDQSWWNYLSQCQQLFGWDKVVKSFFWGRKWKCMSHLQTTWLSLASIDPLDQDSWAREDEDIGHTYLARRSTMITKVVPLGWGLSIAHRLGWPLRLPQTWVTRARNFW